MELSEIRRLIAEAGAKGLTRNPDIILDVAPGESPTETIARMQGATEFVSGEEAFASDNAETAATTEHRIAQIRWTPELLLMMGRGRFEVVDNALPDDVEIVSVSTDVRWAYQEIVLTVKSASFAVVPEGAEIPMLPPAVIRRLSEGE